MSSENGVARLSDEQIEALAGLDPETIERLGETAGNAQKWTRRGIMGLLGGGALAAGGLSTSIAGVTAQPDGDPAVIGQQGDRVDIWGDQGDWNELDAGIENTRQLNVAPSRSWGFDSIQAAIDEVDKSGSGDIGLDDGAEIHLWERTSETDITVSNKNLAIIGKAIKGPTETTPDSVHIDHSGGDGLIVQGNQDNLGLRLENLSFDGGGSGQSIVLPDGLLYANFDNVQLTNAQDGFVHTGGGIQNCNFNLIVDEMSRHGLRFDWGSSGDYFNANSFERLVVRGVDVQRGIYVDIPSGADFGGNEFHNVNMGESTVSGATEMEIQGGGFVGNQFYGYGFEFNQDAPIINPDSGEGNHWFGGRLSDASHASAFEPDVWDTFQSWNASSHISTDDIDAGVVSASSLGAEVHQTSGQTVSNETVTTLAWDGSDFEDSDVATVDLANDEITVQTDGMYLVRLKYHYMALPDNTQVQSIIEVTGGTVQLNYEFVAGDDSSDDVFRESAIEELSAGDSITAETQHDSGSDEDTRGDPTRTNMTVIKLG